MKAIPSILFTGVFSAKGNLSFDDPNLGQIHVSGKKLASLDITDNATLTAKAPLHILINERLIQRRDPLFPDAIGNEHLLVDKDGAPVMVKRLEVSSIYASREDMKAAMSASTLINMEVASEINAAATSSGLSPASITALLESSLFS